MQRRLRGGGGIDPLTPAAQSATLDEENGSGNVKKVSTEKELIDAVNAGGEIELQTDIALSQPLQVSGKTTINGQHHIFSAAASFNGKALIVVGNDANLVLNDCILDGSSTSRGLWIGNNNTPSADYRSAEVYLNGSTIQNGSAADGGGVYLSGYQMGRGYFSAKLYMTSSTIQNCTASGNGGGVYFSTAQNELTLYSSSAITNCSAENGGGVYLYPKSTLTMATGSSIGSCTATQDGGGAYLNGSQSKLIMNDGSTIENCNAANNGGGAYLNGSSADLTMKSSSIKDCTSAQNGGGVYLSGQNAHLTPDTSGSITGCSATSGNGGGIYCGSAGFINLNNRAGIIVTDCSSGGQGGGLFFAQNASSHDLSDCVIYNNTAETAGNDLYLSTGNYNYNLPDYSRSEPRLIHKTDSAQITGWYPDNEGSRYQESPRTPSVLGSRHTLSITGTPMGLVACSTIYDITFDATCPSGSQAYSDPSCSNVITSAAPGERVYLESDSSSDADSDCRTSIAVTTDSDSPLSVPIMREGDTAYFIMPAVSIKEKVIVSLAKEYKITVIGGYAGLWSSPTTPITYAEPDDRFCLCFTGSGTFKKWVWDAVERPDGLNDDDSGNTQANFPRFTMPNHAVTVWAITEENAYQVYVEPPEGIEFSNPPVAVSVTETAPETQAAARAGTAVTSANAGQTVSLTFDPASLPADCQKTFGSWVVKKAGENGEIIPVLSSGSTSTSFIMPASDVVVAFTLNDAGQPDTSDKPSEGGGSGGNGDGSGSSGGNGDSGSSGGNGDSSSSGNDDSSGSGADVVIAGAVIGAAGYLAGTHVWLAHLYGFIPENRIQLALALWNRADCPEPESTELYPDIDEDDDDAQAAARWCVEQSLMKDYHKTDKEGHEEITFKPCRYVFRLQAIKAWYDLEDLLNEQQAAVGTAPESDVAK